MNDRAKAFDNDLFWDRYDREVSPGIERACKSASRIRSDNTMDPDDMAQWVHTRVWRMLEKQSSPTFHDDPDTDTAIDRLTTHTPTLARWAYFALSRKHWRTLERESTGEPSRVEILAATRKASTEIEDREEIDQAIEKLRTALPISVRQKLAASMQNKSDRTRTAMVLGATRREDDRLITKVGSGVIKENTVQQMRSRARKHAAAVLGQSIRLPLILVAAAAIMLTGSPTEAGEQSGGRKPGMTASETGLQALESALGAVLSRGEQSGGRKGG